MENKEDLEILKTNVINWYDFKNTNSILVLGKIDNVILDFLKQKFKIVKTEENNDKFDYIFIMNYFDESSEDNIINKKLQDLLEMLNDDGKILLVLKNKLGAREIINESFNGFSRDRILDIIKDLKYRFYYMLSSEEYVNVIFTDNNLPSEVDISRNLDLDTERGIEQNDFLKSSLKDYKNDFKTIANIFFIEIGEKEIKNNINKVYFSNIRNREYRITTKILDDAAVKEATDKEGIDHIKQIHNNIDILNKLGIKTLDSYDGDKVISKLSTGKKLDELFIKSYKNGDDEYKDIYEKLKCDVLMKLDVTDKSNNVFEKHNIEVSDELLNKMTFVKYGFWDLNLRNIFVVDDDYYVYDQEWMEENIPIEFILYRGILVLPDDLDKATLINKLGLSEFINVFNKLEEKFSNKITNKNIQDLYVESYLSKGEIEDKLEKKYRKEIDDLTDELNQKNQKIDELQFVLDNSRALKLSRRIKKIFRIK